MNVLRKLNPVRRSDFRVATNALIFAAVCFGSLSAATAMECPVSQAENSTSAIRESRRTISELSSVFAQRGTVVTPEIIAELRQKNPRITNAELTNYLIAAYCPAVNRDFALSEDEKRAAMKRFAHQVGEQLR